MSKTSTAFAAKITTIVSVTTNAALSIIKITVGSLCHSTALIADGIHSIADTFTDILTFFLLRISTEEADENHPYGHGKFETFGTMTLSILLAITAIWISYEGVLHVTGKATQPPLNSFALWAAFISILFNEGLYHFCKYWGKKAGSKLIIANAWHHRTDSLSSVAALVGIGCTLQGISWADGLAAIVVGVMLIKMSYSLGREAFDELVDAAIDEELNQHISSIIKKCYGVISVHELRARKIGGQVFLDVHVEVANKISVSEGHAIAEEVEKTLLDIEDIHDVVVHIDPYKIDQIPLPDILKRSVFEPKLKIIVEKNAPKTEIKDVTLHILHKEISITITVSKEEPTPAEISKIKKELQEKFPITNIEFKKLL